MSATNKTDPELSLAVAALSGVTLEQLARALAVVAYQRAGDWHRHRGRRLARAAEALDNLARDLRSESDTIRRAAQQASRITAKREGRFFRGSTYVTREACDAARARAAQERP